MAKNDFGTTNIFNITEPQRYRCQVLHYHVRVSRLYVRVYKDQQDTPLFYLLFSDVGYLQCPISWQGLHFNIGTQEACIELMLKEGLIGRAILQFPNAYASITEYARLYEAQTTESAIHIIASSASLLERIPPEIERG